MEIKVGRAIQAQTSTGIDKKNNSVQENLNSNILVGQQQLKSQLTSDQKVIPSLLEFDAQQEPSTVPDVDVFLQQDTGPHNE